MNLRFGTALSLPRPSEGSMRRYAAHSATRSALRVAEMVFGTEE